LVVEESLTTKNDELNGNYLFDKPEINNSFEKFHANFCVNEKIKQNADKINISFDFAVKRDV
jgi:hypothetical protein